MIQATLQQLADVLQVETQYLSVESRNLLVKDITTDTRFLGKGDVFLALRGATFDGHQFVADAIAQGAIAAIVEKNLPEALYPLLQVPDTLAAYQTLGRWWREQLGTSIVAVTGSVGKTTTKELIAAALSTQGPVLKTQANYNNEIGVPKTLLQLDEHHAYGVVEMGMRGPGEIALLSKIAQPDVAVITNVGTAHIGRLGSEQAIANAKCELLAEMPSSGIAILNHDDARLLHTAGRVWTGRCITYGLEGGDVRGHLVDMETLEVDGVRLPLPLPGHHNALNYLAAIAVMQAFELDWTKLAQGLTVALPSGRARRLSLPQDVVILDETYNAGLESMIAALRLLAATPGSRRIAVLGTMKELGDRSVEFHHQVGQAVNQLGLDHLLILADPAEAEALASGASAVTTLQFLDQAALVTRLNTLIQPGDRILFKASRAVALDQVVDAVVQAQTTVL
ncbi:MAG TPA: UDP-N-acetylmuramoyl-tripeptide--D-alanyl-D-alanine ligase [Leptolyngbyaceae cyanobacterium]